MIIYTIKALNYCIICCNIIVDYTYRISSIQIMVIGIFFIEIPTLETVEIFYIVQYRLEVI